MKRVLLILPFTALLLFYACIPMDMPVPPAYATAVVHTLTATMWTPTIIPTVNPDVPEILQWLNKDFLADDLALMLDARYDAFNAWFLYLPDNTRTFYLEIHCTCAFNSHCCIPERTFVITMHAMKNHADEIIAQVPDDTVRVDVACHNSSGSMGVISAPWADVKAYLLEEINGYLLGMRVTPVPPP
jgi:hypothetical protein